MNVIIIDDHSSSKINGIGTYIRALILILKSMNANIYLVAYHNDCESFSICQENGIKILYFPSLPHIHKHKIIDKFLGLYLSDSSKNLFLFNYSPCELFLLTIKKRFPLSKITFTIHDMMWTSEMLGDNNKLKEISPLLITDKENAEYKKLGKYFREEQRMYKIVDRVITLSQNTCRLLIDTYKINSEKIAFISNGIDDFRKIISIEEKSLIKSKLLLNEHEKIILFVGRTHFAKGVYSLIKSFEKVLVCYPNCRLVFVGAVLDFSKISYYTKNISSKIIFTGQLTKEELNNWYQIADIGVLPSYSEQCSYTGMEMMMYQIPIIASDGFGVNEMFKDGINAKVAKTGNRSNSEEFELNITNAILELLNSEDLSQKLGKNARKIYENSYHIKYMQKGYRKLFEKLLDL